MHCNLQLVIEISEGGAECMAPAERFKRVVEKLIGERTALRTSECCIQGFREDIPAGGGFSG